MGGSFKFARVLGIDLKVHWSFLFIVILAALQGLRPDGMHWAEAAFGIAFILLLFVCVTLHELGHSVAAMRYGITVREIVLLPIGGVAVMGR
ncbi:MAG TPA: site-2 protease family protein, partial [Humisphaera sp.]